MNVIENHRFLSSLYRELGLPGDATGNWGTYYRQTTYITDWYFWSAISCDRLVTLVGLPSQNEILCEFWWHLKAAWRSSESIYVDFSTHFLKIWLFKVEAPVRSILMSDMHWWSALLPTAASVCPSLSMPFMSIVCLQKMVVFRNRQR